jgi:iron complex transport system substrate-binding protein
MPRKVIVSLLPGATEMVAAIGAVNLLAAVSHECDWPPAVSGLPRVTVTPIDATQSSAAIDRAVREAIAAGKAVIGIDADLLAAIKPDLIITQQLCDVCAVADGEAVRLARVMAEPPEVLVLSGTTLGGVRDDIRAIGRAIGREGAAEAVAAELDRRVRELSSAAVARRPRVVVIEWLDPLFLAGHWVPEMVAAAGGIDIGAQPGDHSTVRNWDEVMALEPDAIIIALCGFDEARARRELDSLSDQRARDWLRTLPMIVIDGNAYTSRPGPRLVDGIALMAAAFRGLATGPSPA